MATPRALSALDVLNIAVEIEHRGAVFYETMSRDAERPAVGELFRYLTQMEQVHIDVFQKMLNALGEPQPSNYSDDYDEYINALADNAIFTDDLALSQAVTGADSDNRAMELGMRVEKDSILFYEAIKDRLPEKQQPTVSRVIAEEKSHLRRLAAVKKTL